MPSLRLDDFSQGLWTVVEPGSTTEQPGFAAPANALLEAENLDYLKNGGVRGRRGSEKFNASPVAGPFVAISKLYIPPNLLEKRSSASSLIDAINIPRTLGFDWSNARVGLAQVDQNAALASHAGGGDISNYLVFLPFIGSYNPVPADATITRIEVRILRQASMFASIRDDSILLVKDEIPSGTDKADTGTDWPRQYEVAVYGDPLDGDPLWGQAWTPDDINTTTFGVAVSTAGPIGAAVAFIDYIEIIVIYTTGLTDKLITAHIDGSDFKYSVASGGSFTPITGGTVSASTHNPRIIPWSEKQKLFIFDGENSLLQYDGMEITVVPTGVVPADELFSPVAPRRGPYAALHKGRLYATEPSEIASSVYASRINNEQLWDPGEHLNVTDSEGGIITGIESFGDSLIILKDTGLFAFIGDPGSGGQLIQYDDIGCFSPDSIVNTPFGVIYVGRNGVYLTDGTSVTPVSRAIRSIFVSRETQDVFRDAVAVYFPRRQQYWLKLDPTVDEVWILHRVMLPTAEGENIVLPWSHIPICPMNVGFALPGAPDEGELYLGDTDGFLWLRDTGTDDDGDAYTTRIRTRQFLFDDEARSMARVNQVKTLIRTSAAYDVELWYDQAISAPAGFSMGATTADPEYRDDRYFVPTFDTFGRFISCAVESAESLGAKFEVVRLDLNFLLRTRRVWR